jgi:nicotinate phosphoribosyltransferase
MLRAYLDEGMEETAVFECFARQLPACRGVLMAAGQGQALGYLEHLRVTPRSWVG